MCSCRRIRKGTAMREQKQVERAHPNQVLTFREWCAFNRISARTGGRILASGNGPTVTQLSPHRIGITIGNNAAWQASRERG
jgi:hypothetical protein